MTNKTKRLESLEVVRAGVASVRDRLRQCGIDLDEMAESLDDAEIDLAAEIENLTHGVPDKTTRP